MRQVRDIVIALGIGVVWAMVIGEVVGYLAATGPGQPAGMGALASGDAATFVMVALLRDIAIYAIPSLLAGYLITRLLDRPVLFALVAGSLPFLFSAYGLVQLLLVGSFADARGVYSALNAMLVLVAIPASVALLQYSTRIFPGATSRAS